MHFSHELSDALIALADGPPLALRVLKWLETPVFLVVPPDRVSDLSGELRAARIARPGTYLECDEMDKLVRFVDEASATSRYVLISPSVVP